MVPSIASMLSVMYAPDLLNKPGANSTQLNFSFAVIINVSQEGLCV
jgi:hypothetical protein